MSMQPLADCSADWSLSPPPSPGLPRGRRSSSALSGAPSSCTARGSWNVVLKLDDPVWAVAVHGLSGVWGLIAVGIFADGTYGNHTSEGPLVTGLIYGDALQLVAQLVSAGALLAWTLIASAIIFIALKHTIGLRISEQDEIVGVDEVEHTQAAYPEFEVRQR